MFSDTTASQVKMLSFSCALLNCFFSSRLADKELQRKSLEDSLNAERSSGASRETDMQVWSL